MGVGKPVKIAILADAREAVRGFASTSDAAEKAGKSVEASASRAQRAGKLIDKMSLASAAGFAAVGAGALKLAQGAAEDQKAAAQLAKTLQNNAKATSAQVSATEDWITAQGKQLGIADDELRPALGQLATATGSVSKAQKLTSLAMDISAGSGKSLASVTAALAKAQKGSVGGLAKLGIATKDATGKTKSFSQLQSELAQKFKGQAATAADTVAGKMGRVKLALSEAGESIGYMLIPWLTKLATWLTANVIPALDATFAWMDSHQGTVKALAITVAGLGAAFITISAAMRAYQAVAKIAAAAQVAINVAMTANPIGLVIVAIAGLAAGLVLAYKKSETFRDIVNGAFAAVSTTVTAVGTAFKSVWDNVSRWLGKAWDYISGLPAKIKGAFTGLWAGLAEGLKSALNSILHLPLQIPAVSLPGIGKIGGQTLIPALANGGIVNRPTLALIGEAGPEAVVPLSRRQGFGGDINHFHFDGVFLTSKAELGRLVDEAIDARRVDGGRQRAR